MCPHFDNFQTNTVFSNSLSINNNLFEDRHPVNYLIVTNSSPKYLYHNINFEFIILYLDHESTEGG